MMTTMVRLLGIDSHGYRLQMGRPNTGCYKTQMVESQSNWDGANQCLITEAMGERPSRMAWPEMTIALDETASPEPARAEVWSRFRDRPVLIDLLPETDRGGDGRTANGRVAPFTPALVMHEAEALSMRPMIAIIYGTQVADLLVNNGRVTPSRQTEPVHLTESASVDGPFAIIHRTGGSPLIPSFGPSLFHRTRHPLILHAGHYSMTGTITEA